MAKKRNLQQCMKTARDGRRCGRYCAEGETVCSAHQVRKPTGVIAMQDTDDLGELLKRLTKDRDPAIRLRAIEARLKWDERRSQTCSKCEARADRDRQSTLFLRALSDDERERLQAIVGQHRAFKEEIYAREPSLRPDRELTSAWLKAPDPAVPEQASSPIADERSAHPTERSITTTSTEIPGSASDPAPEVALLPRERYSEVGLITLRSGAVTHALGDDHATKILRGDIPFAEAKDMHDRAQRQSDRMAMSLQEHQHG